MINHNATIPAEQQANTTEHKEKQAGMNDPKFAKQKAAKKRAKNPTK